MSNDFVFRDFDLSPDEIIEGLRNELEVRIEHGQQLAEKIKFMDHKLRLRQEKITNQKHELGLLNKDNNKWKEEYNRLDKFTGERCNRSNKEISSLKKENKGLLEILKEYGYGED